METGGSLMKVDFTAMTLKELKRYVLAHRNDQVAFQALIDRIDTQPQDKIYGDVDSETFSVLLEQHRNFQGE
jgi:hypothetical protein